MLSQTHSKLGTHETVYLKGENMQQSNPTLYGKDSAGNIKQWSVYTDGEAVAVAHGRLNGKITMKSYQAEAKNVGRSNETTPTEQAEIEALAKWTKQLKRGYYQTIEEAEAHVAFTPMKCQDYKDFSHKVRFPGYAQYKLNGLRSMINEDGECLSKAGEVYKLPKHWECIPGFIQTELGQPLDGEVFAGLGVLSLQVINGAWKKYKPGITEQLGYYVYDIPVPDLPFKERVNLLEQLAERIVQLGLQDLIHVVHSEYIENQGQLDAFYAVALADKAEGIVYRNEDGVYEFGKRSYDVIKRKPRGNMEVKVLSVVSDKNGDGVLTGETKDGTLVDFLMRKDAHETINFRKYENAITLIGQFTEIEYEELSDDGVPTKPVGVRVREMIPGTWEPAE